MEINNGRKAGFRLFEGKSARRSQSLVEFALTLPVLLTILAGVVEVGNVLTIYNRVQLAAREGARFGAQGGADQFVTDVVEQASRDSINVDPDRMKVWVVRPIVDTSGTWKWKDADTTNVWGTDLQGNPITLNCVFPNPCPASPAFPLTPSGILKDLKAIGASSGDAGINGTKFVVVAVYYEPNLILNLPWFSRDRGRFPMWAYATMRQEVAEEAITQFESGCSAYPLLLNKHAVESTFLHPRAYTPDFIDLPIVEGGPAISGVTQDQKNTWDLISWNIAHTGPDDLTNNNTGSIIFPGNSLDPILGFQEFGDPGDNSLHIGDWVLGFNKAGGMTKVRDDLVNTSQNHSHAALGRELRIMMYEYRADDLTTPGVYEGNPRTVANGSDLYYQYQISGFVIIKMSKTKIPASQKHATFEFVDWYNDCGNVPANQ